MLAQLQTNNGTFIGRYWNEYNVLRRYFSSDWGLSILSFGCSTGEEMRTVKALFPRATIFGCDHDWYDLRGARSLVGDFANVFHSTEADVLSHGPYDIILCNSVLLRPTSMINGKKCGIAPEQWSDIVDLLNSSLKPGGILQIINSNIPFRLHPAASSYEPVRSPLLLGPNFVDMFDLERRHLCSGVTGAGMSAHCFRHLGEESWRDLRPSDFDDVHFRKSGCAQPLPLIDNEKIPNVPERPAYATGTTTYRPVIAPDSRPSTYQEIDVTWTASASDVYVARAVKRVWFDGSTVSVGQTSACIPGIAAGSFLEAVTGRASSRTSIATLAEAALRSSPSI